MTETTAAPAPDDAKAREARRDVRLDFFRGLGMFIIVMAHIPANGWNNWIPARFGFSDATEIFVFCSGAASAIAFLKVFDTYGWWTGTARVSYRVWQLYWCHIGVFFAVLTSLLVIDQALTDPVRSYVGQLNLSRFLDDPASFLPALFTLRYVPNFFDILVMYMVILAMMPLFIGLAQWKGPKVAMAASVFLWALVSQPWLVFIDVPIIQTFNLPAEPVGTFRTWFFNPFTWQLLFFTGFSFAVGWLPKPPVTWWLILICVLFVVFAFFADPDGVPARRLMNRVEALHPLRDAMLVFYSEAGYVLSKTFFGLLRYLHFLAIAYLAWVIAGDRGRRLPRTGLGGGIVTVVRRVGQQSLAVFIAGLLISRLLGVVIYEAAQPEHPRDASQWLTNAVNIASILLVIAVAYIARYFRAPPWAKRG